MTFPVRRLYERVEARRAKKEGHPECWERTAQTWNGCYGKERRHGECHRCGKVTCRRGAMIDPYTLRRTLPHLCSSCWEERVFGGDSRHENLQKKRLLRDWRDVTAPVNPAAIVAGEMPEYAGRAREAIRAFLGSEESSAVVPDMDSGSLQATIQSLGLQREIYAEQRAGRTVLRKGKT